MDNLTELSLKNKTVLLMMKRLRYNTWDKDLADDIIEKLSEIGLLPTPGMIIFNPTSKRQSVVLDIYDEKIRGVDKRFVKILIEKGYTSEKYFDEIIDRYCFVGYSVTDVKRIFEVKNDNS